jgi:hypothetical protein
VRIPVAAQDQYIQLSSLPEDVRKQVLDFIEFLMERRVEKSGDPAPKELPFGMFKGKIRVAEDFDAPLDDFKDYM